jgi:two-component system phosphate regulon sensor histidine kinase PhoR
MADEASPPSRIGAIFRRWNDRLYGRRAVLVAATMVFALLAVTQRLTLVEAAVGFLAILIVAFAARRGMGASELSTAQAAADQLAEGSIRRFADALPDPCVILDGRGFVTHRNAAAAAQFPTTREGDPIAFSIRNPGLLTAIEAARQAGEPQSIELHQTGSSETWHKVTVSPLAQRAGRPAHLVVTMQSLTEQRRIESLRSDFIANASHELRTPLTSLVGFIDTLMGPAAKDAAARDKFLDIMRAQAARMSKLIDDLLSLSRIEMRQHLRPTTRIDLAGLLMEVKEGLATQAAEAGVAIDLELPAEHPDILADHDELYEVFENLLDNAIKYGGDGGRVIVELAPAIRRPGFDYIVSVTDFGAGIAAEHVPRLTERFYRVDAESSRKKKGTGLGLAIVKHILNRHRGTLSIRSAPGQGTRVEVLLPR